MTVRLRNADLSSRIGPPLTGSTDAEGRFRLTLKKPALVDVGGTVDMQIDRAFVPCGGALMRACVRSRSDVQVRRWLRHR